MITEATHQGFSVLDFVESMVIDEKREYPLSSYLRGQIKHSDHFTEILSMNICYNKQKPIREEFWNFKSTEGQIKYTEILNTENSLTKCFDTDEDTETQVKNWLKMYVTYSVCYTGLQPIFGLKLPFTCKWSFNEPSESLSLFQV